VVELIFHHLFQIFFSTYAKVPFHCTELSDRRAHGFEDMIQYMFNFNSRWCLLNLYPLGWQEKHCHTGLCGVQNFLVIQTDFLFATVVLNSCIGFQKLSEITSVSNIHTGGALLLTNRCMIFEVVVNYIHMSSW